MFSYFAYGSNMDPDQMAERCPDARGLGAARLPGYRLAFTRFSPRRQCGVADVVRDDDSEVWGVLYELSDADLRTLDLFEGFVGVGQKNGYDRISVVVHDARGQSVEALTYVVPPGAKRPEAECVTSSDYLCHLIEGARYWKLPEAYREMLGGLEP
ncbi:MAG: gamma-glutamylcyclotransferase family protein [Trueperaceae bacterium]|nr:gamma-glutamylcyclotransferase family protein [Trueperaceae bacterium]